MHLDIPPHFSAALKRAATTPNYCDRIKEIDRATEQMRREYPELFRQDEPEQVAND